MSVDEGRVARDYRLALYAQASILLLFLIGIWQTPHLLLPKQWAAIGSVFLAAPYALVHAYFGFRYGIVKPEFIGFPVVRGRKATLLAWVFLCFGLFFLYLSYQFLTLDMSHRILTSPEADYCPYLPNGCPGGAEFCPPRWEAFHVDGVCRFSRDSSLPLWQQWIDSCDEHRRHGVEIYNLKECYFTAALQALHPAFKQHPLIHPVYKDALALCEKKLSPPFSEGCKKEVCDNLERFYNSYKQPFNRSEQIACYKASRQETSCSDGEENGGETDIDCGGPCPPCGLGKECIHDDDCQDARCYESRCFESCPDGIISEHKPCGCGPTSFFGSAPDYPRGLYCCADVIGREECT